MKPRRTDRPHPEGQLSRCIAAVGLLGASLGMTLPVRAEPESPPAPTGRPAKTDAKRPAGPESVPSRQLKLTAPKLPDGHSRQDKRAEPSPPKTVPAIDSSSRQYKVEYTPLPDTPELAPPPDQDPLPPR